LAAFPPVFCFANIEKRPNGGTNRYWERGLCPYLFTTTCRTSPPLSGATQGTVDTTVVTQTGYGRDGGYADGVWTRRGAEGVRVTVDGAGRCGGCSSADDRRAVSSLALLPGDGPRQGRVNFLCFPPHVTLCSIAPLRNAQSLCNFVAKAPQWRRSGIVELRSRSAISSLKLLNGAAPEC
jgi:hypothetical protein